MTDVKVKGIWIAFGISAGLHVMGLGFAKKLPREPILSSSVPTSIRLIKPTQKLIQTRSSGVNPAAKQREQLSQISVTASSLVDQNNEAQQAASSPVAQKSESIFSRPIRYLDWKEVDSSGELLSDWILRTEGLQSTDIVSIQLTLFISEDGNLDNFEILKSSLGQSETELLVRDLALTVFKPASKDGKLVPSQQNVEILLDPTPPKFRIPNLFNNFLFKNQ